MCGVQAWDPATGPSDEQVNAAMRVLRAEYWASIRAMATDLVRRVDSGELDSDETLSDAIHADADGCQWAIYTAANYRAMLCSDADPYELAADEGYELGDNATAVLAYLVVRHDVTEQVAAELGGTVEEYLAAKTADAEAP